MDIRIASVPQHRIRADQVDDWWAFGNNCYTIHVLETLTPDEQLRIAIHALVEAFLCHKAGITEEMVSRFDYQYESERKEGKHDEQDEPGDDSRSPYREQHSAATFVERAVCGVLGISWTEPLQFLTGKEGDHP